MTAANYLLGIVLLTAVVVPVAFASTTVRRLILPDWTGAVAWLAGSVIFLALLFFIMQVLGTFGLFSRAPIVVACLATGLGAGAVRRRRRPQPAPPRVPARSLDRRWVLGVAVAAVGLAATPWLLSTWSVLHAGIGGPDSVYYHLPFAARFAQSGRITQLHFAGLVDETPFDPENSELVHALGMVLFHRDVLSPLLNLLWFAFAGLAAWCVGQRRGAAPATLAAMALLLAGPLFVQFDAGQATNDAADVGLLLAAVALILHGGGGGDGRRRAALALAAAAAGLGLSNKLSLVIPVAALTIAVAVWNPRASRRAALQVWLPCVALTGSFWYLRNLFRTGSPLPSLALGLGPISLPHPHLALRGETVAGHLFESHMWSSQFFPGLHGAFGAVWPLTLGLAVAGIVTALASRDRLLVALAGTAVVSFLAYLRTPEGIGGPAFIFRINLRFLFPALVIGLVLLPLAPVLATATRQLVLTVGLLAAVVATQASYAHVFHPRVLLFVLLGAVLLLVGLMVDQSWRARVPGPAGAVAIAAIIVTGVAVGGRVQHTYLALRYRHGGSPAPFGLEHISILYHWADHTSGMKIAVGGFVQQYPLYGRDLSNDVRSVVIAGPHGQFSLPSTCAQWRRALNDGHYDYVAIAPSLFFPVVPREALWTRGDPAVRVVVGDRLATVFRITGRLHPERCPAPLYRRP